MLSCALTFRQGTPGQNEGLRFRKSFFDGLQELGYMEGRDFDVVIRHAGSTSELPKAAEQLVQLKPDVIFAAETIGIVDVACLAPSAVALDRSLWDMS